MLKRIISAIIILCIISLFFVGCNEENQHGNDNESISTLVPRETSNFELLPVCRFPQLEGNENVDVTAYNEANLVFNYNITKNPTKENDEKKISVGDKEFITKYVQSRIYSNDTKSFLSKKNVDCYDSDEIVIDFFSETGAIRFLGVSVAGEEMLSPVIDDFSETSLRKTATNILQSYYGEEINNYLKEYYRFEYGKKITYSDSTLDRYVVSFRAYIQDIPTDDVILVHFSTTGVFIGLSAKNYLQYLDYNAEFLFLKKDMDEKINEFLEGLEYEKTTFYEKRPYYYSMNTMGELYYVTNWECISSERFCVETIAIKAD